MGGKGKCHFFLLLGLLLSVLAFTEGVEICEMTTKVLQWEHRGYGALSPNAYVGGRDKYGGAIYVGRQYIEGNLTPGKCNGQHLFIGYGGLEHSYADYELLVEVPKTVYCKIP